RCFAERGQGDDRCRADGIHAALRAGAVDGLQPDGGVVLLELQGGSARSAASAMLEFPRCDGAGLVAAAVVRGSESDGATKGALRPTANCQLTSDKSP